MIRYLLITMFTCACTFTQAQVNIITTVCGDDTAQYSGDGGLAIKARLKLPSGICMSGDSCILLADAFSHAVRKIDLNSGIITTIAGNGIGSFSGDGGIASKSQLFAPEDVCVDNFGNIYVCDAGNNRIRKIDAQTKIITTIVGSGPTGLHAGSAKGDGGPATDAELNNPSSVCVDTKGNIYIADYNNNRIRRVDASIGIIVTIAGNGSGTYIADGVPATNTGISGSAQVITDTADNLIYCDQYNHIVRRVDKITGLLTTIAGNGIAGYSGDNSPATNAQLNQPTGLSVDKNNNIFIATYSDGTIGKINSSTGIITTAAGSGVRGFFGDGGPSTSAKLMCADLFVDRYGTIFIADMDNFRIRMVYDSTLKVGVTQLTKNEVHIYPNPASNELTIDGAERSEVSIYNTIGQRLLYVNKLKDIQPINIATLMPGMYIIQILNPDGSKELRRFVKE